MKNTSCGFGYGRFGILWCMAVLLSAMFPAKAILAGQEGADCPPLAGAQGMDKCESSEAKLIQQSLSGCVDKTAKTDVVQKVQKLHMPFIANNGQTDERVKFYANTFGGTVFVTKNGEIVYTLPKIEESESIKQKTEALDWEQETEVKRSRGDEVKKETSVPLIEEHTDKAIYNSEIQNPKSKILGITLKEEFVGARTRTIQGEDPSVTKVNYFKGNNPEKWKNNISTYDFVNLGEIYKGIELKLKAYGNNVEKLFCVKPGASPDQIKVQLGGAKTVRINKEGQLEVETELGEVKFTKPVAYQEIDGKRVDVECKYTIADCGMQDEAGSRKQEAGSKNVEARSRKYALLNPKSTIHNLKSSHLQSEFSNPKSEYGFKVASYDKTKDLIIDPLLASTYVGGSDYDRALSIAIDTGGNVYVGGSTISSNFPTTTGVYDASFNGGASDAFLLRSNADLTNLLASTYLGGTKDDYIYSIVIDTGGNVYMCGDTGSSDFPTTTGAYDTSINNGSNYYDGFVSKLDNGLTSLLASTYLGGSNSDHPRSVTKDSGGNIYVHGMTYSSDFPVTTGVYDTSFNGGVFDSFISKFNGTLASLLASTYLGGSGKEYSQYHGPSLAIDTSGNILVTGTTYSSDFPTTTGVYDTSLGGDRDTFVSKISGDLTNLLASTYLGGSIYDEGYSIAGDSSGNIYVAGYTYSSDFPTTTGAYDTSYNSGNDAFVSKFNGSLTGLLASTYLGGSNSDEANALVIDSSGNIYIAGYTDSSEFPTTASAYDTSRGGATDAFISEFNGALTSLLASTYLGGSGIGDVCYSLAIDSGGNIYATGYTKSSDFPTTTGAYDTSYNDSSGSYDTFIAKLDSSLSATSSDTTAPSGSISINSGASYTNSTTVTLTLSATDSTGVTGYYLSDSSTTPSASASGWTSITSTTSYSATVSYSLSSGEGSKTIYAWYKDAAGNVSSTASATITLDTTVPTVTISSPTSSSTYTATSSTINLGGSASDSSSGISSVAWSNNRGGNGTSTGTASWTVSSISLSTGDNVITVTAKDGANNSGTDTLQVTYGTPTTISAPTVSTGSASNVTTSSATLNGIINANGGTTTAWFQYGSTSGSYGNTSSTQTVTGSSNTTVSIGISGLSSGTNYYYRIAASNSAGTSYGGESSFTTSTTTATPTPTPATGDTTAPTVTIASPTSSATYTTTSSTITLSGTASDNSGSVSSVTWSNSKGGSGTANGTTSWTISSISLSVGDNVITVTATDGSGNFGTDTITVTYTVTTTPTPTAVPTATATPKPSPTAQPTPTRPPTLPPLPTPLVPPSPAQEGVVFGFVNDEDEQALEGVTVTIVGANGRSPLQNSTETDENGYYEFRGLDAGEYALTYEKEGYKTQTMDISLEEGELKDVETVILEQVERGKINGYAVNIKGDPIEFVRLKLRGIKTKVTKSASTDADGFFEFTDLDADTYVIVAKKKGYRKNQQKVKLGDGESEEIEIVMKKTSKRIKKLLLEEDIQ